MLPSGGQAAFFLPSAVPLARLLSSASLRSLPHFRMGPALQVFFSRLSSSVILWGVCSATMYWAYEPGFWLLLSGLILRSLWEFFRMLAHAKLPHFPKTGLLLGALLCLGSLWTASRWGCESAMRFESLALTLCVLWIFTRQMARTSQEPLPAAAIAYTLLGVVYIPFLGSFTTKLLYITPPTGTGEITGHFYLLFLVLVTKFSDCGAYLVGSLFGKHRMIPHISPKKTWEGFVGALLLSVVGSLALLKIFPTRLPLISLTHGVVLGLLLSVIAVVGDLAESIIKRSTTTKDSGHFLPGIGGAMDLIDSLLFTGPVFYLYLRLILGA